MTVPGISVTTVPNQAGNELIGVSDGRYAFDTNRPDGQLKLQASAAFKSGNTADARLFWEQANAIDSNDAEVLIYLEDQNVLASHKPYITLVVGTTLTGGASELSTGRDNLQGAYVAQKEYNEGAKLPHGVLVRLLIANAGSQATNAVQIAQQIVQAAKVDSTIVGVMGWPYSAYAQDAIRVLTQAQIPMVSTASSDFLTGVSSYFFRVVPSNIKEAMIGARYVQTYLHAQRILLFTDYNDDFSGNLARDFTAAYGSQYIVKTQIYLVGKPATLKGILDNLLVEYNPDLIYFAGYPNDLIALVENQLPQSGQYASLKIMGGDALYEVGVQYPPDLYSRLLFTSAAFPDVWTYAKLPVPQFYSDYAKNFDAANAHPRQYGWSRADADSILSYNALLALLNGSANAMSGQLPSYQPNPQDVERGLNNVTPFQGASGLVFLDNDGGGNPTVNPVIVILTVDSKGNAQIQHVYGCLTQIFCYS